MNLSHAPRLGASVARVMSIQDALAWAFDTEKAQLDFDTTGAREFDRMAVDPVWLIARRAELGCTIDGVSTAVQNPATRRRKTRPGGGGLRHGARAYHRAGACHGALAPLGQIEAI